MSEEVLGIFPGWVEEERKKIKSKGWTCRLIFTTERLIVAKEKRFGGRLNKRPPDYIDSLASPRERLKMQRVDLESVMKADPENFAIVYSDISAIERSVSLGPLTMEIYTEDLDVPEYRLCGTLPHSTRREPLEKQRKRKRQNPYWFYWEDFNEFLEAVLPGKVSMARGAMEKVLGPATWGEEEEDED